LIEEFVSEDRIKGYTLKQLITTHLGFLSRFGYSQTEKILEEVIGSSVISDSETRNEFFLGRN